MRILLLALTLLSCNAWADWSTSVVKDEMRGTETEVTDTTVHSINGNGPELYVSVLKTPKSSEKINISFKLLGSSYNKIDCNRECTLPIRFDNFKVIDQRFIELESGFIMPDTPLSLIRGISLADVFYIEIPLTDGSRLQYKIDGNPLAKPIEPYPQIEIFNLKIGADKSTLPPFFTSANDADCFSATDIPVAEGYFKVKEVFVCLAKGKIASISFDVTDNKQRKALHIYLTKQFGSLDKEGARYQQLSWPNENGRIHYNTVRAFSIIQTHMIIDASHDYFQRSDQ